MLCGGAPPLRNTSSHRAAVTVLPEAVRVSLRWSTYRPLPSESAIHCVTNCCPRRANDLPGCVRGTVRSAAWPPVGRRYPHILYDSSSGRSSGRASMMTVRDTPKRGEALCGTSAHCVRSCARHTRLLGRKHEPWGGQRCAHPSVLRASQQRDRIAVLVRRNAEGKEEQEGEAEEHRVPCFGASRGRRVELAQVRMLYVGRLHNGTPDQSQTHEASRKGQYKDVGAVKCDVKINAGRALAVGSHDPQPPPSPSLTNTHTSLHAPPNLR